MTLLIGLAIRSSVVLAVGLLLTACLRHRSAALRHRVLAATMLGAALVIPSSLALPQWFVTLPPRSIKVSSALPPSPGSRTQPGAVVTAHLPRPQSVYPVVIPWLAGVFVTGGAVIVGLARVSRVAARALRIDDARWLAVLGAVKDRYGLARHVELARTDSPGMLATWGVRRPQVLLPSHAGGWSLDRVHVVLCHELAHIRRHDWLVQLCAEGLRALIWFNPLAWMVCSRLRREGEQACDDEVLGLGVGARLYATHLIDLARRCRRPRSHWASAVPMAHPSTLERRIAAMLNPRLDRRAPSRPIFHTLSIGVLLVSVAAGALSARHAAPLILPADDDSAVGLPSQVEPASVAPSPARPAVTSRPAGSRLVLRERGSQATLTGTIYDVTGGVLPGVQVTLVDANEGTWTTTSNASGRFEFPGLGPGRFALAVTLAGFRTLRHEFELRDARDWDRAITLQVGEVKETVTIRASRVTPAQMPPPQPGERVRVGGNVRPPRKLLDVKPTYPAAMREAGLTGVVPIEAVIGQDGTVSSVRVLSAQVHPDFAIAAVDAVRQWRFSPTLLNGTPVEVVMTVSVQFDLRD